MENLLKALITETKLTPYAFAKELGKHHQQINNNIDNGGDMKFSTLVKYANYFGIKTLEVKHGNCKVKIRF